MTINPTSWQLFREGLKNEIDKYGCSSSLRPLQKRTGHVYGLRSKHRPILLQYGLYASTKTTNQDLHSTGTNLSMTAPHVLSRICTLATERNLLGAFNLWNESRQNEPSGAAYIGNDDMVEGGNGIFWSESTRVAGVVFLYRPGRVLVALEQLKPARSLEEIADYLLEKNAELYERLAK